MSRTHAIKRERTPPAKTASLAGAMPAGFDGRPVERRSLSEEVAERIMGMIKSGNLKPGDRLPTEQQMCVAFAISRPPLREALKALSLMGVVESRQGGRYTITDLSPGRLGAQLSIMESIAHYDAAEHFEARAAVDLALVRMCTERANDEERRRISALASDGRAFHANPVAFRLLDIEFHQSLNAAARNETLAVVAQNLYDFALDQRRTASEVPGAIKVSVDQHCAIAEAVAAGDADAAVAAYRIHLDHVRDTTIQLMSEQEL